MSAAVNTTLWELRLYLLSPERVAAPRLRLVRSDRTCRNPHILPCPGVFSSLLTAMLQGKWCEDAALYLFNVTAKYKLPAFLTDRVFLLLFCCCCLGVKALFPLLVKTQTTPLVQYMSTFIMRQIKCHSFEGVPFCSIPLGRNLVGFCNLNGLKWRKNIHKYPQYYFTPASASHLSTLNFYCPLETFIFSSTSLRPQLSSVHGDNENAIVQTFHSSRQKMERKQGRTGDV